MKKKELSDLQDQELRASTLAKPKHSHSKTKNLSQPLSTGKVTSHL